LAKVFGGVTASSKVLDGVGLLGSLGKGIGVSSSIGSSGRRYLAKVSAGLLQAAARTALANLAV
jgi:hypothetical protein